MVRQDKWLVFIVLVLGSTLVGLIFATYPLSAAYSIMRPELLCLVVLFWTMNAPEYLGISYAWIVGLLQDIVEGSVWGGHALALSVVSYVCLVSYQRIRNYSVWHQSIWVFVLVGVHQVMVNWVQGMAGYHSPAHILLLPTMVSALGWPVLYLGLRRLQRIYHII